MVVYQKGIEEGAKNAGKKSFRTVTGMLLEQQVFPLDSHLNHLLSVGMGEIVMNKYGRICFTILDLNSRCPTRVTLRSLCSTTFQDGQRLDWVSGYSYNYNVLSVSSGFHSYTCILFTFFPNCFMYHPQCYTFPVPV